MRSWHWPALQAPPRHEWPQLPQLLGSVLRLKPSSVVLSQSLSTPSQISTRWPARLWQEPLPLQRSALAQLGGSAPHTVLWDRWLARHAPAALQVSSPEHSVASSPQGLPAGAGEYSVLDTEALHTRQGLPGSSAPSGTQMSSTRQPSQVVTQASDATSHSSSPWHWFSPGAQAPVASSQLPTPLHATLSSQARAAPPQLPALHTSSI